MFICDLLLVCLADVVIFWSSEIEIYLLKQQKAVKSVSQKILHNVLCIEERWFSIWLARVGKQN